MKIAVIGLGYVGIPLFVELARDFKVVGFDISENRVQELMRGHDRCGEVTKLDLDRAVSANFVSTDISTCSDCDVYIVTVPTPLAPGNLPDLDPLLLACDLIGQVLEPGNTVIFESTVFPGCTEDTCMPALEKASGLDRSKFHIGYSPERINPGDKNHTLRTIKKVISANSEQGLEIVHRVYSAVVDAGVHVTSSIRVAEAAKVIENTQRDINIAFINELHDLFGAMDIDVNEVLDAANTKWNFLDFRPGLVGGHCIGIDPYYLAYKAQKIGKIPDLILAGRKRNEGVPKDWAEKIVKTVISRYENLGKQTNILIAGLTFKENCPDFRNSKSFDFLSHLNQFGLIPDVLDPYLEDVGLLSGLKFGNCLSVSALQARYDVIVPIVNHKEFELANLNSWFYSLSADDGIFVDLKGIIPRVMPLATKVVRL